MSRRADPRPAVILGAGLSGLSLACALLEQGYAEPLLLLDRRSAWERDRTWCTWASDGLRFAELAGRRWERWSFRHGDEVAVQASTRHPYLYLDAGAVYAEALARLGAAPNVELRRDVLVRAVHEASDHCLIETDHGPVEAAVVFDAMGPASPLLADEPPGAVELIQSFLGWEVEAERPVFDPQTATLMDFRSDGREGLRFLYVLPLTSTRALIEDTSFSSDPVRVPERRRVLEDELRGHYGLEAWTLRHEERGRLPMSTRPYPVHRGTRVHAVGGAAGAIRPSSGYAFSRIQDHCTRVARAFIHGEPLPERVAPARLDALDGLFLRAFDAEPEAFPEVFMRLGSRVSGDLFARFMTDRTSELEEARIVTVLPKGPFLRAAARARMKPPVAPLTGALPTRRGAPCQTT